jgi:hypothetical protein
MSKFFVLYIYFLLTFGDSCVIIIINNCNLKMKKQIPFFVENGEK